MESGEISKPEKDFTLDEVLSRGFDSLKEKFWSFLGLVGLAGLISILPSFVSLGLNLIFLEKSLVVEAIKVLIAFGGGVLAILMTIGLINIQIKIVRQLSFSSNDLWSPAPQFWSYLGSTLIFQIVRTLGFICFIIPGIFVSIAFQFYPYFIVEHKMGPIAALKASGDITEGARWELLFLWVVLAFIKGIGLSLLLVGIIPAEFFERLSMTQAYRVLLDSKPEVLANYGKQKNQSESHGLIQ